VSNSITNRALVSSYFASFNSITVKNGTKRENNLKLKGTVEAFSLIFNTTFIEYTCLNYTGKRATYAISSDVYIPQSLQSAIVGILGLETIVTQDNSFDCREIRSGRSFELMSAEQANLFTGHSAARIYGVPDGTGAGVRVGIVSLGGYFNQSDLQAYFDVNGLGTAPIISIVYVDGAVQNPNDFSGSLENYVDVEMISSVATQANITMYMGVNTNEGFYNVFSVALQNSDIVSCGWGKQEIYVTTSTAISFQTLFAAYSNVPIFVATGIRGSYVTWTNSSIGGAAFPASCPNAIGDFNLIFV
jgi:kumamolisin